MKSLSRSQRNVQLQSHEHSSQQAHECIDIWIMHAQTCVSDALSRFTTHCTTMPHPYAIANSNMCTKPDTDADAQKPSTNRSNNKIIIIIIYSATRMTASILEQHPNTQKVKTNKRNANLIWQNVWIFQVSHFFKWTNSEKWKRSYPASVVGCFKHLKECWHPMFYCSSM